MDWEGTESEFEGSEEIRNVDDDIKMMHMQYVEYQEQWEQVYCPWLLSSFDSLSKRLQAGPEFSDFCGKLS